MRRVGQWAKDIEDGAYANLAPCRADVFHSRVIRGSEHEAEADFADTTRHLFGTKINARTQSLQHISATTAAGGGTVAVFRHRCARGCYEDACSGRDVKRPCAIAAGATGIERMGGHVPFQVYLYCLLAHDTSHTGDLLDGLPAGTQAQCR